jgi:glycosyltransferase involved in cell wall biosynthesis
LKAQSTVSEVPRLSIGFPVYNGEKFLRQALDSLLQQSFTDFELIISDNASHDKTGEICLEYANEDRRIYYYRNEENIGVDRNFNRTFQLSRGEYFRWTAADDISAPVLLGECVSVLDASPDVVLTYPKSRYIDEYSQVIRDYEDRLHLDSPAPHRRMAKYLRNIDMCNAAFGLIRSSVLRQTDLYGAYADSDIVLLGELALYGRFHEIPKTLFFRRIHPDIAVRKYPTAQERMAMSEPKLAGKLFFPHWKVLSGLFGAIQKCPLGLWEKALCYAQMRVWAWRERLQLERDLRYATRQLARKIFRRGQARVGRDSSLSGETNNTTQ